MDKGFVFFFYFCLTIKSQKQNQICLQATENKSDFASFIISIS